MRPANWAERLHVLGVAGVRAPLAGLLDNRRPDRDDVVGTQRGQPVRRTSLTMSAQPVRRDGGQEVLELVVENKGLMTALFCAPHPLIEYRTDLFVANNHCFIPPGERRTISIRHPASRPAMSAAWLTIHSWNGASPIRPYFTTSARPAENSRAGSGESVSVSVITARGW